MIEDIESLRSEFYVNPLRKVRPFDHRHIVVRLERTAENIPAERSECRITGAGWIGTANDLILIVYATAADNESVQVNKVVEPVINATARQDRTRSKSSAAAVNEVRVL